MKAIPFRSIRPAQVELTESGMRQLLKAAHTLGVKPVVLMQSLCHELSTYLAAHEAAGVELDTKCQEVRYDDGVYLLLRRTQGVWYITDVFLTESPEAFVPVYTVKTILRGIFSVLTLVFTGWRALISEAERKAVVI